MSAGRATLPPPLTTPAALWLLIRVAARVGRNEFRHGSLGLKLGLGALTVLMGGLAWLLYSVSGAIVWLVQRPRFAAWLQQSGLAFEPGQYLTALPAAAIGVAMLVLLLTGLGSLISGLYQSNALETLMAAPLPRRAVFAYTFFAAMRLPYLVLLVGLAPLLLGYGRGMGLGAGYYLAALAGVLLLPLLPVGLSALLVLVIVRVATVRRALEIIGLLSSLLMFGFYLFSQVQPRFSGQTVALIGGVLAVTNHPWMPSAWLSRALTAAGRGDAATLLLNGGLFALVSLGVFGACLLTAERLYYNGWSTMVDGADAPPRRRPAAAAAGGRAWLAAPLALLPAPARAVFLKDLRVVPRDLSNIQHLLYPAVLAAFWLFRLITDRSASASLGGAPTLDSQGFVLGSVGITFYLCAALSGTLSGGGISREGQALWLLRAAPISAGQILLGKLVLAFLPYPLVGGLVLGVIALLSGGGPGLWLHDWPLLTLAGLGSSCLGLGLGAAFPRLDSISPDHRTSLRATALRVLIFPVFLALLMGAVVGLPLLAGLLGAAPAQALALAALGWLLAGGLTALVAWLSLRLGARALERLEL